MGQLEREAETRRIMYVYPEVWCENTSSYNNRRTESFGHFLRRRQGEKCYACNDAWLTSPEDRARLDMKDKRK